MKINLKKGSALSVSKGFTLIELLVVVAIIGVLAAVILPALNTARAKGVDAAIRANMANSRSQAGTFYDDNNQVYTNVCSAAGGIGPMVLSALEKLTTTPSVGINTDAFVYDAGGALGSGVCHDSGTAWAAIVSLKAPTNPGGGWCVDSTGASKEATSLAPNATICP